MGRNQTWKTPARLWRKLQPVTRRMRREPTDAERILWEHLSNKKTNGIRFRRQHPIDWFIVDFYSPQNRIVIELDGGIHLKTRKQDEARENHLKGLGYKVIRFRNEEVENNLESVLTRIREQFDS